MGYTGEKGREMGYGLGREKGKNFCALFIDFFFGSESATETLLVIIFRNARMLQVV